MSIVNKILQSEKLMDFDYLHYKKFTRIKKQYHCLCGNKKDRQSIICFKCSSKTLKKRKVIRPSKEELTKLVMEQSLLQIGKQFNVSDNAVRKWCKYYEINNKSISPFSHNKNLVV
jgi:hypothetical protein